MLRVPIQFLWMQTGMETLTMATGARDVRRRTGRAWREPAQARPAWKRSSGRERRGWGAAVAMATEASFPQVGRTQFSLSLHGFLSSLFLCPSVSYAHSLPPSPKMTFSFLFGLFWCVVTLALSLPSPSSLSLCPLYAPLWLCFPLSVLLSSLYLCGSLAVCLPVLVSLSCSIYSNVSPFFCLPLSLSLHSAKSMSALRRAQPPHPTSLPPSLLAVILLVVLSSTVCFSRAGQQPPCAEGAPPFFLPSFLPSFLSPRPSFPPRRSRGAPARDEEEAPMPQCGRRRAARGPIVGRRRRESDTRATQRHEYFMPPGAERIQQICRP
ncbi:uncharacterized protein LOC119117121 isoform X2 [Syngnathus acus]|uniref:uncharacterized protein LOC119117121 isoform X2 n=1 Tax=Syngnathus acus TaxID=161584 RepID=UPI001885C65B|nr:uncharacterized protein LOC119117121 isoform X2 [Syngnathus acus]XP_037099048.1 uncharacterized protein LOC119117121 isoform X2 [Syngnathus acus]